MDESTEVLDVQEWTVENVVCWMKEKGFLDESSLFEAEEINGKNLIALDKSDLKDIGVKTLGRRIGIMTEISKLKVDDSKKSPSNTEMCTDSGESTSEWLLKVKKGDKDGWTAQQKLMYKIKTGVIVREAAKVWPGNSKVYFKQNQKNRMKLEELVASLTTTCVIKEIGFGREAKRSHILQWAVEKNRKITDGYDYELKVQPAKRASLHHYHHSTVDLDTSTSSSQAFTDGTDTDKEECGEEEQSEDPNDINRKSAQIVLMCYFGVNSTRAIGVKEHLLPLEKKLGVKCRSLGKYAIIVNLAKKLLIDSVVTVKGKCNFKQLKREQVVVKKMPSTPSSSSTHSSNVSSEEEGGDTDIVDEEEELV